MGDINKVISILEVNKIIADKLIATGNCILLEVGKIEYKDMYGAIGTEFRYSIGQIRYGTGRYDYEEEVTYVQRGNQLSYTSKADTGTIGGGDLKDII